MIKGFNPCHRCGNEVSVDQPKPHEFSLRSDPGVYVKCSTCATTRIIYRDIDDARSEWNAENDPAQLSLFGGSV